MSISIILNPIIPQYENEFHGEWSRWMVVISSPWWFRLRVFTMTGGWDMSDMFWASELRVLRATVQVWRCRVLSVLIRNTKALQHPAPTLITDVSTWCILISPPWIDWLMIIHNTDNWWSQTWRSSKKPLQVEWIRLIEHDRAKEKRIWTQPGTRH